MAARPQIRWMGVSEMSEVLQAAAHGELHNYSVPPPNIGVDSAKLARMLRRSGRMTVGFLPTSPEVRIQPMAVQIAFALSLLTQNLTTIFDPEQVNGAPAANRMATMFSVFSPAPFVATLVPRVSAPIGSKYEMVKVMNQFAEPERGRLGHILVDLSGCQRPGELLGALRLVDGIIVVARGGFTKHAQIMKQVGLVPADLCLGVVLTD